MSSFGQWKYTADRDATILAYGRTERGGADTCNCAGCRNFRVARADSFPADFRCDRPRNRRTLPPTSRPLTAHCLPQSTPLLLRPPRQYPIGYLCGLQKWPGRLHSPEVGDGAKRKGSMSSGQASTSPLNAPAGRRQRTCRGQRFKSLAPQANQPVADGMAISLFRLDARTGGNRHGGPDGR
jgi:hypothetical protein